MSYTTPPTFVAAAILAAADLDILSDDITYLKGVADALAGSGVRLTKSGSVSLSTGVYTAISWTAATFDEGNWWTSGSSITVPTGSVPGGYSGVAVLATGKARFASNSAGVRFVRFKVNGTVVSSTSTGAINGDTTDMDLTDRILVVDADVITMEIAQSSGGSLNADQIVFSVARDFPVT